MMNLHGDMIKQLYYRAEKQFSYMYGLLNRYERKINGAYSEMSDVMHSLTAGIKKAREKVGGALEEIYTKVPPSYETFDYFRKQLRFSIAYHQLWTEYIFARNDMLCAPKNGLKYPFYATPGVYKEKEAEAIEHPEIVDREIKAFRDRLHEGFLAYGAENARKCEERMKEIRNLPYPI